MEDTLFIYTDEDIDPTRGLRDFIQRVKNPVSVEAVKKNVDDFYEKLKVIFSKAQDFASDYTLDEITINAEIGADGSVGFLGTGAKGSAKVGISFTLKKKP